MDTTRTRASRYTPLSATVILSTFAAPLLAVASVAATAAAQAEPSQKLLFEIGQPDNRADEFLLGPDGFERFPEVPTDPVYVVRRSTPKEHWPYVHPGVADRFSGKGRYRHRFQILFTVAALPKSGTCRLVVDLLDHKRSHPPAPRVTVNGRILHTEYLPGGGGLRHEGAIAGNLATAKQYRFTVEVPVDDLRLGTNLLSIHDSADGANLDGGWAVYDYLALAAPVGVQLVDKPGDTAIYDIRNAQRLIRVDGAVVQPVDVRVFYDPEDTPTKTSAVLTATNIAPQDVELAPGINTFRFNLPALDKPTPIEVTLSVGGDPLAKQTVVLDPIRPWVIYLLPHSHTDIGYTKLQSEVERDMWEFIRMSAEASRKTVDYPPGAQFKWNVEVLWAVESYLRQATPDERNEFIELVRSGWVGLDALYCSQLTGNCRSEELVRLLDFSQQLSRRTGVKINSAMITDVPNYTWGLASVFSNAGVRYFSIAPNKAMRNGCANEQFAHRPFWWVGPDGKSRVLAWGTWGYHNVFLQPETKREVILQYLVEKGYPYDYVQIRYCLGDNAAPALDLCDEVRQWNEKYISPKMLITTTSEMFEAFEKKYGHTLPEIAGDPTPVWEDGVGSSARETGLNRASAERLSQAETIWAMQDPKGYPADRFYEAWRNVILYDEHTWGAHTAITAPDCEKTRQLWQWKQAYALDADRQSRRLLAKGLARHAEPPRGPNQKVRIFNTCAWPRTDLVVLRPSLATRPSERGPYYPGKPGTLVTDTDGNPMPTQRLSTGELAFIARDVPALGMKTFVVTADEPNRQSQLQVEGNRLSAAAISVVVDPKTGAIVELRRTGIDANLVDTTKDRGLNDYIYLTEDLPHDETMDWPRINVFLNEQAVRSGPPVKISVKERGPVLCSLLIEGPAPGARSFTREIRLIAGKDHVDIRNVIDKEPVRRKECVRLAFPFAVPNPTMRMHLPWAIARVEEDQTRWANRNWFTVQQFVDVAGNGYGVTCATLDAPLVEVGDLTAQQPWLFHLDPTGTFYSWVMNNCWFTNYRAEQQGPTVFRYAIRPYLGEYDGRASLRFALEQSRPLIADGGDTRDVPPQTKPRLTIAPDSVILQTLKPTNDRQGLILRLFGAGDKPEKVKITFEDPQPTGLWMSDVSERRVEPAGPAIELLPGEMKTVRADLP